MIKPGAEINLKKRNDLSSTSYFIRLSHVNLLIVKIQIALNYYWWILFLIFEIRKQINVTRTR